MGNIATPEMPGIRRIHDEAYVNIYRETYLSMNICGAFCIRHTPYAFASADAFIRYAANIIASRWCLISPLNTAAPPAISQSDWRDDFFIFFRFSVNFPREYYVQSRTRRIAAERYEPRIYRGFCGVRAINYALTCTVIYKRVETPARYTVKGLPAVQDVKIKNLYRSISARRPPANTRTRR